MTLEISQFFSAMQSNIYKYQNTQKKSNNFGTKISILDPFKGKYFQKL